MTRYGIKMRGIGVAAPDKVICNEDLTELVDTSNEWIYSRTGFRERRVVQGNELVTDLAIRSSRNALEYAGMTGEEIDLIILASSTPDHIYPQGCSFIQTGIGAHRAFGFDVSMGCSGLIYSLGIATQFVENGRVKNALVVGSDTHSRFMDWYDRNTSVLFGDGSGAFIISRAEPDEPSDMLAFDFMLDGSRGHDIRLPNNRDNCPLVEPRTYEEKSAIYMNGRDVFKFALSEVPRIITAALEDAGMTPQEIDFFILHQANARIMSTMPERLNIAPEAMIVHLEKYSNTSAASIPLAFYDALMTDEIPVGSRIVLCGFGAGMAVATAVVNWNCSDQRSESVRRIEKEKALERVTPKGELV